MQTDQAEIKKVKPKISQLAKVTITAGIFTLFSTTGLTIFHHIYQSSVGLKSWAGIVAGVFSCMLMLSLFCTIILTVASLFVSLTKRNGRELRIALLMIFAIIIYIVFMVPTMGVMRPTTKRKLCRSSMEYRIGRALSEYAKSHNGYLPEPDKWCDTLIMEDNLTSIGLLCTASDAVEGESSYAMNSELEGMKLSQIPKDVVVIFETDSGKTQQDRQENIENRKSHQYFYEIYSVNRQSYTSKKIYAQRWNQSGGLDILTAAHHNNVGANILFGDLHAEFVTKEKFSELKWK